MHDASRVVAPPAPEASRERGSITRWLIVAAALAACVPIAVATIRALARGWMPLGDNAFFLIRARDVFSEHRPLLGTWSSSSLTLGVDVNNPGPLYFDALAVPVRVFGGRVGTAVGAAFFNAAAALGAGLFAYRRGGALLATLALAIITVLCWSMGSELLYEPWQPNSLVLPFFLLLVLVWSVTCGDLVALPFAAAIASLLLQTHLSYLGLAPLLGAWAVVGLLLHLRRSRQRDPDSWPALRRSALRSAQVTALVLVLCWVQPLIEQFTSEGDGNITRLSEGLRETDAPTLGYGLGVRVMASVVALPPWWFRPSFGETLAFGNEKIASLWVAVLSLLVVAALLAWCLRIARSDRDRPAALALTTAAIALMGGILSIGRSPETVFRQITPHTLRWLWPLGGFVVFAIGATILRRGSQVRSATPVVAGLAAVAVCVAAINLPTHNLEGSPAAHEWASKPLEQLDGQLASLEDSGPVVIDGLFTQVFDPYGAGIVAELQRRDIDFVARSAGLVRQLGPERKYAGSGARSELVMRTGASARTPPPRSRRVAFVDGLAPAERRERTSLQRRIESHLEEDAHALQTDGGVPRELTTLRRQLRDGRVDVELLAASGDLQRLVSSSPSVIGNGWRAQVVRYLELDRKLEQRTVGLYVRPVGNRAA